MPGVPQFRFDQKTQYRIISSNRNHVKFGKTSNGLGPHHSEQLEEDLQEHEHPYLCDPRLGYQEAHPRYPGSLGAFECR